MVDVFISYAREDRDTAAHLAGCLQQHGWSVWWGNRRGYSEREYSIASQRALSEAHAVLVLWSKHSVTASSVLSEASDAMQRHVLVPVTLELGLQSPPDLADLGDVKLIEWSGDMTDQGYVTLERAIARLVRPTLSEFALSGNAVEPPRVRRWTSMNGAGLPLRAYGYALGAMVVLAAVAVAVSPGPSPNPPMQRTSALLSRGPQVARIWPTAVQASSMAAGHAPQAAFDGKMSSVWRSKDTREGSGEWIQAQFSRPMYVEHVVLRTGAQATSVSGRNLFYENARPRQLRITTERGMPGNWVRNVQVGEHEKELEIDIGVVLNSLRFEAVEIWSPLNSGIVTHGNVAISEIEIYGYALPSP